MAIGLKNVGAKSTAEKPEKLAANAQNITTTLPELILQAQNIANNVSIGAHGRKKHGIGEDFWQFRPYIAGEALSRIDWRRSARDDHMYIRDHEWEAAQTIYLFADETQSMHYCSSYAKNSKNHYALLLLLTLAEIFAKKRERVAVLDVMPPSTARNICERIAMHLMQQKNKNALPDFSYISRFSHVMLMSDFLDDPDEIMQKCALLTQKQVHAHFIEICDPAESLFPYIGRTEFNDPETGEKILTGQAQNYQKQYAKLYQARREVLQDFAKKNGWHYHICQTDKPITDIIYHISMFMALSNNNKGHGL